MGVRVGDTVQAHRPDDHLHAAARRLRTYPISVTRDVPGPAQPRSAWSIDDDGLRHHVQHGQHGLAARPGLCGDPDHATRASRCTTVRRDEGEVHFADLDIYDAALGGRSVRRLSRADVLRSAARPTRSTRSAWSLPTTTSGRTPLLPNPTMFSINGANYVIDTNRDPARDDRQQQRLAAVDRRHRAGRPGRAQLDVHTRRPGLRATSRTRSTICSRSPAPRLYPIAQPTLTFKLDRAWCSRCRTTAPAPGNYSGSIVPIASITAGSGARSSTSTCSLAGPNPAARTFFTYKNVLYTLMQSTGTYVAVQKTYTVYAATADRRRSSSSPCSISTARRTSSPTAPQPARRRPPASTPARCGPRRRTRTPRASTAWSTGSRRSRRR